MYLKDKPSPEDYEYTTKYFTKKGEARWLFDPPRLAKNARVAKRKTYEDGRVARIEIPKQLEKIKLFQDRKIAGNHIASNSSMYQVFDLFIRTDRSYITLRNKKSVIDAAKLMCETKLSSGQFFGDLRVSTVSLPHVKQVAEKAGYIYHLRAALNFAIERGVIKHNAAQEYLNSVARKKSRRKGKSKRTYWTRQEVLDLLDVAFSDFKTRNVGILVLLIYQYAQPFNVVKDLKWDDVDFTQGIIKINGLELPMNEAVQKQLELQKEDFGFQDYVAPRMVHLKGWVPHDIASVSKILGPIKKNKKSLKELRQTAIKELLESGTDIRAVMSLTGLTVQTLLENYYEEDDELLSKEISKRITI